MTREIKFRAWEKDEKEMFRVTMISFIEGKGIILSGRGGSTAGSDCELMQFTGLKDKNGVEIYEGDIVKWCHPSFEERKINYKVLEVSDIRKSLMIEPDCKNGWIEIIGNIYQNPELLK